MATTSSCLTFPWSGSTTSPGDNSHQSLQEIAPVMGCRAVLGCSTCSTSRPSWAKGSWSPSSSGISCRRRRVCNVSRGPSGTVASGKPRAPGLASRVGKGYRRSRYLRTSRTRCGQHSRDDALERLLSEARRELYSIDAQSILVPIASNQLERVDSGAERADAGNCAAVPPAPSWP
jgi:hypothetical protein